MEEYLASQGSSAGGVLCVTATLGKILTMDNLRKRHIMVVEWCCLCKKSGESIDHLLLHCEVASELWSSIFNLFGVVWVMPRRVIDLLNSWGVRLGVVQLGKLGSWLHCVYGGVFGGRGMLETLKMSRLRELSCGSLCFTRYILDGCTS
jgi:hypothetical protein